MYAFIILSCHLFLSQGKIECDLTAKKIFNTEKACNVYSKGYTLSKGEQLGYCDEVPKNAKKGDSVPLIIIKK